MSRFRLISKRALLSLCHNLGINYLLRERERGHLLVLCYHSVIPDGPRWDPFGFSGRISVKRFSEQMEILSRLFHPISPSQLRDWWSGSGDVPKHPVLVTFDDGYRNNLTLAAPVLMRFGVPALINVCTGYVGQKRILWPHEVYWRVLNWPKPTILMPGFKSERRIGSDLAERISIAEYIRQKCKTISHHTCIQYLNRLREYDVRDQDDVDQGTFAFLSWEDLRALKNMGFEIGSHTVEHPILSQLQPQELCYELEQSKITIARELCVECSCIAYPNGTSADISDRVIRASRVAGYKFGFTSIAQFCSNTEDSLMLGRMGIRGDLTTGEFRSWISGLHSRLQHLRLSAKPTALRTSRYLALPRKRDS